ncbi:MAG: hypothetical protein ACE14L_10500 [Terriglobales bacterium]
MQFLLKTPDGNNNTPPTDTDSLTSDAARRDSGSGKVAEFRPSSGAEAGGG